MGKALLALGLLARAGHAGREAARPAAPPSKAEVASAYQAAKSAVVNANLLLTSGQARLKRVQFAFNEAGEAALRERAKAAFESYSKRLAAFRQAADAIDAGRPELREAEGKAASAAPAPKSDPSTTELLGEIAALRAAYDPQASRRRAAELRAAFGRWGGLAKMALQGPQRAALEEGRRLAEEARAAARTLAPKRRLGLPGPARTVEQELDALKDDAAALEFELELLASRYRLDNLIAAQPELATP